MKKMKDEYSDETCAILIFSPKKTIGYLFSFSNSTLRSKSASPNYTRAPCIKKKSRLKTEDMAY
jgi:hypothetical protein